MSRARFNFNATMTLALLLILTSGGEIGSAAPPYASPDGPTFVISADLSMAGDQAIGKTHPGVISAATAWADKNSAGRYLDDVNQKTAPTNEPDWVQAAWKVADRTHPPSIVGAGKSRGIKPQALPTDPKVLTDMLDSIK
jgi:hypothetical protein